MTIKFDSGFDPATGDIDAHYTLVYSRILQTNSILAGWMTEFMKLQEVERNKAKHKSRESRRVEDSDSCDGCVL